MTPFAALIAISILVLILTGLGALCAYFVGCAFEKFDDDFDE